ncbi:hypothetical protein [Streptomyces rhizosphaerihabitans]|uniref:hypothetical protein n=1 Tax=Streptomyces rhizosphaerihabitans TaxID=1266770 RepID=UPI0021BF06F6|nr:hypothetical protein [Streptomyces rhizosphaerihabitans]MCT9005785.1 hypothetical protein [Streptomyces rhizosphaerihabitans]
MLRILDARTGEPTDAALARGLVRVHVHLPGFGITGLRVLLVADVLVRALEIGGNPVWATLTSAPDPADAVDRADTADEAVSADPADPADPNDPADPWDEAGLRARAAQLGIRPFEDHRDTEPGPVATRTIDVLAPGAAPTDGLRVEVAPVDTGRGPAPVPGDPTALRLALLARRRDLPLRLDADALAEAEGTLKRWRAAVAGWATRPSKPVPEDVRLRMRAAWEDDLDVLSVLDVLRWVETSDVVEGARFETYAYADRLLGLELTREIGTSL